MKIDTTDFEYIRGFVRKKSSLVLEDRHAYLVEVRLGPILRQEGLHSLRDLVQKLQTSPANGLHQQVVEALLTNETFFYRDIYPFEAMRESLIPDLIKKRQMIKQINIWSASCSSGQEPYSIAMLIKEHFPELRNWTVNLVASDLSHEILKKARRGIYNQMEINRGLPPALLEKYFEKNKEGWQINQEIRSMVEFIQFNLSDPWPGLPHCDIVMLRNVMIYFDIETRQEILKKVRKTMKPDGALFLGTAETPIYLDDHFIRHQHDKATFYRMHDDT